MAQLRLELRRVPGLLRYAPDLLAVRCQPRVPRVVVAFLPGAAVGLVGVELDHEAVVGPVDIDGEGTDRVVRDRRRDAIEAGYPAAEPALPAAARVRQVERPSQRCGARFAAP